MATLVVALPKQEEASKLKGLLIRNGFDVAPVCTSGAQAITVADELSDGLIICGYRLSDGMMYRDVYEDKPKSFDFLLLASEAKLAEVEGEGITCLAFPLKVHDLIASVEMLLSRQRRLRRAKREKSGPGKRFNRDPEEQKILNQAKAILMDKNRMTEPEAFRYIQKSAMASGNTLKESALMVIELYS